MRTRYVRVRSLPCEALRPGSDLQLHEFAQRVTFFYMHVRMAALFWVHGPHLLTNSRLEYDRQI